MPEILKSSAVVVGKSAVLHLYDSAQAQAIGVACDTPNRL